MKRLLLTVAASVIATGAAFAEGDIAAGEKAFKKCKACHAISDPDGNVIVKGGKVGPNLYGIVGRTAGSYEGFRYSASLTAAGEAGLVWTEEEIVAFIADPKAFLRTYLDDSSAKSKMTFKLSKGGEDVTAYLASLAPPAE
ncbi:MAG TPA: c-type cytochrome [Aliiroseovarius sp.]|nr:c-type cytochrome [Aliiroseovarius sp.]